VWYVIRTRVNNREPLFRRGRARTIFIGVFRETARRFAFAFRGFRLTEDWLTFYIKPEEWRELPAIMKWMKQPGDITGGGADRTPMGDRYGSRILEREPAGEDELEAGRTDRAALHPGVRPHGEERPAKAVFSFIFPPAATLKPG
jgi:hypothetical protein